MSVVEWVFFILWFGGFVWSVRMTTVMNFESILDIVSSSVILFIGAVALLGSLGLLFNIIQIVP